MSASIGSGGTITDDAAFWATVGGEPEVTEYDAACIAVDAWRKARTVGIRRVSVSSWRKAGAADEVQAFATESSGFVAKGRGATIEAATIDLARCLAALTSARRAA